MWGDGSESAHVLVWVRERKGDALTIRESSRCARHRCAEEYHPGQQDRRRPERQVLVGTTVGITVTARSAMELARPQWSSERGSRTPGAPSPCGHGATGNAAGRCRRKGPPSSRPCWRSRELLIHELAVPMHDCGVDGGESGSWQGTKRGLLVWLGPEVQALPLGSEGHNLRPSPCDREKVLRSRRPKGVHASSNSGECKGGIVNAHTIQKGRGLRAIAEDGHVLGFDTSHRTLTSTRGRIGIQRVGIRQASTITGFCSFHDDTVFAPVEKVPFAGTPEQCFLLAYRTVCRELYTKKSMLDGMDVTSPADAGRSIPDRMHSVNSGPGFRRSVGVRGFGTSRGRRFSSTTHSCVLITPACATDPLVRWRAGSDRCVRDLSRVQLQGRKLQDLRDAFGPAGARTAHPRSRRLPPTAGRRWFSPGCRTEIEGMHSLWRVAHHIAGQGDPGRNRQAILRALGEHAHAALVVGGARRANEGRTDHAHLRCGQLPRGP